ncbi:GNAT family N-acetyltransferase [Candidatus Bipolaricaulota bacterium]|nr:GNAT family N-acetyltransferase [Candidatus Bipolaricaulota bacterium]
MLVGHRVILRPFRRSDLEGLYELTSDVREIGDFWPLGCISEPRWFKQFEETNWWSDDHKILLVTDREGRRLGQVMIFKASHWYGGWELAYRIYKPEDRGKGYMTEAVRMATAYLFEQTAIGRIQIVLDPRNIGSRTVAERAGYQLEGTLRRAYFHQGALMDLLLFSIIRNEVPPISNLLAPLE